MNRMPLQQFNHQRRAAFAAAVTLGISCPAVIAGEAELLPQFSDQTVAAGLAFMHQTDRPNAERQEWHMMTPGAAVADFNRDGYLDLFVNGGSGQNSALFINNGDGTFIDRANEWGVDLTNAEGSSVSVGDVNGDGWIDLYVGAMDGRNHLFINDGNGGFSENAIAAGIDLTVPPGGEPHQWNTFGAAFGDIDLDGDLDLYTTQWWFDTGFGNRLFENNGDGVFTDVTEDRGLGLVQFEQYWAFTPMFHDMDGDFFPELLVAADFLTSRYYSNNGDGSFTRTLENGTGTDENGMGAAIGDYDGDGDPDWFVTSIYDDDFIIEANWGRSGNRLYRNDGAHEFTDDTGPGFDFPIAPDGPGVRHGYWGWGAEFGDLDNDGDIDLLMTNGFELPPGGWNRDPDFVTDPTRLWINGGDHSAGPDWIENAVGCGVEHTADGKGLILFDADNDGDLDLFITSNRGPVMFYRNDIDQLIPAFDNTWLQLDLVPPPGVAPSGEGAKVELMSNGATITRWCHTSGSFMSNRPSRVHFGFSAAETIDEVRIHWPNGQVSTMTGIAPGVIALGAVGNIDGDDRIGVADLGLLLTDFGDAAPRSDLNNDGAVDTADLGMLIRNFGVITDGAQR